MLVRSPEPKELMDDEVQALAYAQADFDAPHTNIMRFFQAAMPSGFDAARAIDLGCGAADISIRLSRIHPRCSVDAVDGSKAMLSHAATSIKAAGLERQIRIVQASLPCQSLPQRHYDLVVSNSLLHHLYHPEVLWQTLCQVARPGAFLFIADLIRPDSPEHALSLVEKYAAGDPDILRRDFHNSLLAAFTIDEVREQLARAGLEYLTVRAISDRHLIVHGCYHAGSDRIS